MKSILSAVAGLLALAASGSSMAEAIKPWANITDVNSRFVVLAEFDNAAVFDRSTGLIWEKSPSSSTDVWLDKLGNCLGRTNAGRPFGWRLPKWEEVGTLFNLIPGTGPGGPTVTLPDGHPFTNVSGGNYWTSSQNPEDPADARVFGTSSFSSSFMAKSTSLRAWCVRGGAN